MAQVPPAATKDERGVQNRGIPATPTWATEPPVWGEPVPVDRVREALERLERKKVYRFAYPNGSKYETTWLSEAAAKAWASYNGHRYLGEVPVEQPVEKVPRDLGSRGTEPSLSPPPLVEAKPKKQVKPKPKTKVTPKPEAEPPPVPVPDPKPKPSGPFPCPPGYMPTKSGRSCIETPATLDARDKDFARREREQAIRDYADATLGEGFENAAKVAKWASLIPGPPGRIFKAVGSFFQNAHDAYEGAKLVNELIAEMSQADALAKGSKEVLKKGEDAFTKAAEPILDKILKKKGIALPEPARKELIKRARDFFDKHVRDPAIDKGKREFEKNLDPADRDNSLWDEWSRGTEHKGT